MLTCVCVCVGWTLGISSMESAAEIMRAIFKALRNAGFSWKVRLAHVHSDFVQLQYC